MNVISTNWREYLLISSNIINQALMDTKILIEINKIDSIGFLQNWGCVIWIFLLQCILTSYLHILTWFCNVFCYILIVASIPVSTLHLCFTHFVPLWLYRKYLRVFVNFFWSMIYLHWDQLYYWLLFLQRSSAHPTMIPHSVLFDTQNSNINKVYKPLG